MSFARISGSALVFFCLALSVPVAHSRLTRLRAGVPLERHVSDLTRNLESMNSRWPVCEESSRSGLLPYSAEPRCPSWEDGFAENQRQLSSFRRAIEDETRVYHNGRLPACDERPAQARQTSSVPQGTRIEEIDLSTVPGLSDGARRLGRFRYNVVPPRNPPAPGGPIPTVLNFAGGPGANDSERLERVQQDSIQVITADYIGLGQNAFSRVQSGLDDRGMNLDDYARIMEVVVRRETTRNRMGDYAIMGHSFGSAAATVVAARLSSLDGSAGNVRPRSVVLSGVAAMQGSPTGRPSVGGASGGAQETNAMGTNGRIRVTAERVCVLPLGPSGSNCFDDRVLDLLSAEDRQSVARNFRAFFQGADSETVSALQSFARDAFQWEAAQTPERAAAFLKTIFAGERRNDRIASGLYCWSKKSFDEIPWLNRDKSASAMASIIGLLCQVHGPAASQSCPCFGDSIPYDSSRQIRPPTNLIYLNGDLDTQTPMEGARAHYESQRNPQKVFVSLCGTGHSLYSIGGGPLEIQRVWTAALSEAPLQEARRFESKCENR